MNTPRHQRFGTGLVVDGDEHDKVANVAKFRSRLKVCACVVRNNVILAKCMRGGGG